jgi:ankyrin repeat protein
MKLNLIPLSLLFLFILNIGCGKKPEDNASKEIERSFQPSEGEVYFNALIELKRSVSTNDLDALKKCLQENPNLDLNMILDDGETLLTTSIKIGAQDVRNFLLERGASIERTNVNRETPLIVAASHGKINSLRVLLDRKAEINRKDNQGDTALHAALKRRNEEIALILIKHGANIEITDRNDKNAFKLAQELDLPNVLDLIKSILQVEYGTPDIASFRSIIMAGDLKNLNLMLTRFPRLPIDYETVNPLGLAISYKDENVAIRMIQLLLTYQANINGPKDAEESPLVMAVKARRRSLVDLFLLYKADVQNLDKAGLSALMYAVRNNDLSLTESLVNARAIQKYTISVNGKKTTFNACTIAREVNKMLSSALEKEINGKIKDVLRCGLRWLF